MERRARPSAHRRATRPKVCNLFDILLPFRRREFGAYRFKTGTPAFLIDVLSARGVASPSPDGMINTDDLFSVPIQPDR